MVDKVTYVNLIPGKEYTVSGVLMDKETGKPLVVNGKQVTASKKFTPDNAIGAVELEFTFDASALNGKTLVVFETVSREGKTVAVHTDINDAEQTVEISEKPVIGTTATNGEGGKEIEAAQGQTIVDTVAYANLDTKKTYVVVGILMDKATGEPLLIDGAPVAAQSAQFTPASPNGTVEVTFTVDGSQLGGKDLVVFEGLYEVTASGIADAPVTTHEDINDKGQTVHVDVKPEIRTSAVEKETGEKLVVLEEGAPENYTIIDTVSWTGLKEGKYIVRGILMDKENGTAITLLDGNNLIGKAEFEVTKAQAAQGSGTVDVEFNLNFTDLIAAGYMTQTQGGPVPTVTTVVFEQVFAIKGDVIDDKPVATHEDINDKGQTVVFERKPYDNKVQPVIGTTATDNADGDKVVEAGTDVTVKDVVAYENLFNGATYTVKGKLVVKGTGGVTVVAEAETLFTANGTKGTVDVFFNFNTTGLEGKELVVYEYLYEGDVVGKDVTGQTPLAQHADDNDEGQTVSVKKDTTPPPPTKKVRLPITGLPKTGSIVGVTGMVALMLLGAGALLVRRRNA